MMKLLVAIYSTTVVAHPNSLSQILLRVISTDHKIYAWAIKAKISLSLIGILKYDWGIWWKAALVYITKIIIHIAQYKYGLRSV